MSIITCVPNAVKRKKPSLPARPWSKSEAAGAARGACPAKVISAHEKMRNQGLTNARLFTIIIRLTGCGEVWYRAWFGTKRPRVRIPTLRPNPAEIFRFQPGFSAYSELFPMENFVTFPFDPNATQTGFWSGKRRKISFAACQSISAGGARFSVHFLSLSDACHEAADFLRGFFFHACCDVCVNVQREFCRGVTEDLRDCFRVDSALDCQRRECVSEIMKSDVLLNSGFFEQLPSRNGKRPRSHTARIL